MPLGHRAHGLAPVLAQTNQHSLDDMVSITPTTFTSQIVFLMTHFRLGQPSSTGKQFYSIQPC